MHLIKFINILKKYQCLTITESYAQIRSIQKSQLFSNFRKLCYNFHYKKLFVIFSVYFDYIKTNVKLFDVYKFIILQLLQQYLYPLFFHHNDKYCGLPINFFEKFASYFQSIRPTHPTIPDHIIFEFSIAMELFQSIFQILTLRLFFLLWSWNIRWIEYYQIRVIIMSEVVKQRTMNYLYYQIVMPKISTCHLTSIRIYISTYVPKWRSLLQPFINMGRKYPTAASQLKNILKFGLIR